MGVYSTAEARLWWTLQHHFLWPLQWEGLQQLCCSFVLSLNLAPTGDEHLRLYLLQSPLMISSSSLTHFKPRFFSTVDISAAVCDAQRVGSWPYKAMSALTRAGLMTLSPSWHYYLSQAQARNIIPEKITEKENRKKRNDVYFFPNFNLLQISGWSYPYLYIHKAL